MPGYFNKASALPVTVRQRAVLQQIIRRNKSQQQHVRRAQIILMGSDGLGNGQMADRLCIDRKTVYHWRARWLSHLASLSAIESEGDERALSDAIRSMLSDSPRSGTPVSYTAEMVCQILAVSCEDPSPR